MLPTGRLIALAAILRITLAGTFRRSLYARRKFAARVRPARACCAAPILLRATAARSMSIVVPANRRSAAPHCTRPSPSPRPALDQAGFFIAGGACAVTYAISDRERPSCWTWPPRGTAARRRRRRSRIPALVKPSPRCAACRPHQARRTRFVPSRGVSRALRSVARRWTWHVKAQHKGAIAALGQYLSSPAGRNHAVRGIGSVVPTPGGWNSDQMER